MRQPGMGVSVCCSSVAAIVVVPAAVSCRAWPLPSARPGLGAVSLRELHVPSVLCILPRGSALENGILELLASVVHLGWESTVPASQPYRGPLGSHQNLESHEMPFIHLRACFTGCFWFPVPTACHGGQTILSSTALLCFPPQWPLPTKAFSGASLYSGLPQPPAPATHYPKDCCQLLCCPLCPHPEAPTGLE